MTFDGTATQAWTTLTASNISSGAVQYAVVDGFLFVQVTVTLTSSLTAGSTVTVVTAGNGLSAALRPTLAQYGAVFSGNGVGYVVANTDGSIQIHASTATMTTAGGGCIFPAGL